MTSYAPDTNDQRIYDVARAFRKAREADVPLLPTVNAIDNLLQAVRCMESVPPDAAKVVEGLIFDLALHVANIVAPAIATDRINLGFAAAAGLLTSFGDSLHYSRLLYTALLVAELKTVLFRAEISRIGDPLAHSIAMRRAWSTPRTPNQLLQ